MTDSSIIRRQSRVNALAAVAGYFAMGMGALVLVGWWSRIDLLKGVGEGMISMNPLTALCCLLVGLSLVIQVRRPVRAGRALAAVIIAVGVSNLGAYLLEWSIPLGHRLLTNELHGNDPELVNRIAPNTALGLIIPGSGLLVLSIGIFGTFMFWTVRSAHRADLETKRLEKERESFFSLAPDLFGIAGMDGYFKRVNAAFSRTLGYTEEEILARSYYDLIHPDDVPATRGELKTLLLGQPTLHFENRYRCKDGSWVWLEWSTQPFVKEGLLHAVGRDVTAKKRAEAELFQQACHLKALNLELEAFSYSVSHDLRAPLRGISGFAQALEEHQADKLDATSLEYLRRIRRAAAFMGDLIDDLLQLSRLTRAEMNMKPVDLSEMARELIADHRRAEPERRVEALIAPDIRVMGDPALLRAMMSNLLSNSWKFTSRNPAARIELGGASLEGGKLGCFVRDNGVGFDNRYAHKLFGAFQRLHSQAEFKGTGIGLATVQRIILRHGGEVSGRGMIDEGAIFNFSLDPAKVGPHS